MQQGALSQIGKSVRLKGDISGNEDVYIDGEVEGKIVLEGRTLTVGPSGRVNADVTVRSVTIQGQVKGKIQASERTQISATGSFEGDLVTARIVVEEGATFRGRIDIVRSPEETVNSHAAKESFTQQRPLAAGEKPEAAAVQ